MHHQELQEIVNAAKEIYESRLKSDLEHSHMNEFVAIEPQSGDYFLGHSLSEAVGAARRKHPDRLSHTVRVGHTAAIHFGLTIS